MPSEPKVIRQLGTILSADVKGCRILMADDEVATIQPIKECWKFMSACVQKYEGSVVVAVGDNLLAESGSAVEAVQYPVAVRKELNVRNQQLQADKRV